MTLVLPRTSRSRRALLGIVSFVALGLGALVAVSSLQTAGATHVTPIPIDTGNPTCADFDDTFGGGQVWQEFKIGTAPTDGTYNTSSAGVTGALPAGGAITITNAGVDGSGVYRFDWSANFDGIDAVFVKQANSEHHLYVYAGQRRCGRSNQRHRPQPAD